MKLHRFLCTALLALGFAGPSHADVAFSNLSQPINGEVGFSSPDDRLASDFLTDGTPWTITRLDGLLGNLSNVQAFNVNFSIFTDNGNGEPGALVRAFDTPALVPEDQIGTFTASSTGIDLQANTIYWVVGQVNEVAIGGTATWVLSSSEGTGIGPFSTVPSTATLLSGNGGLSYVPLNSGNYMFALQGTPIPEPQSWLALLVTVGTFVTFRWWRGVVSK